MGSEPVPARGDFACSSGVPARPSSVDLVTQQDRVVRGWEMFTQLLEEVHSVPLDETGHTRLAEIHRCLIGELKRGLAIELIDDLHKITVSFSDVVASAVEPWPAQAQVEGWLEGVLHGIQTSLFAHQMVAAQHLQVKVDVAAATARYRVAPRLSADPHRGGSKNRAFRPPPSPQAPAR